MLGVLITLLFSLGMAGFAGWALRGLLRHLDPAARLGAAGLIGLGMAGMFVLVVGFFPGGLTFGAILLGCIAAIGFVLLVKTAKWHSTKKPEGLEWLFVLVLGLAGLFAFVGVLAPSTMNDWDSLAYHLAVPKLWLQAGRIVPIPFIHHSNFPFTIDGLYVWGLQWGGQSGAKAFSLGFLFFGILSLFGLARQRYGGKAGWWAAVVFATVPVVLWESGTAYIDVGNGLYAGLGIAFAALLLAEPETKTHAWLSAIFLGLAAGSKYTGLQTIFAVAVVLAIAFLLKKQTKEGARSLAIVAVVALAIAAPWYVKNVLWTGNPVYPFFFEQFGGKYWDLRRADIYRNEQQTFGAGREMTENPADYTKNPLEPGRIGQAILGLAYQPGRYVNPGQAQGGGTPLGAVGVVVIGCLLVWLFSGRAGPFEGPVLAITLMSFGMWFFLSEQSRYVVALTVPLALLSGGAAVRLKPAGALLAAIAALQAGYSLYLAKAMLVDDQLPVVVGKVSREEYQAARIPFYEPSQAINQLGKDSKTALYDEVFGYLLDVPYVWANPGHSTLIPYDGMRNGHDFAQAMRNLGFTHVYMNFSPVVKSRPERDRWLAAAGLAGPPRPYAGAERDALMNSFEQKYMLLTADAVAGRELVPEKSFRSSLLLRIVPK